MYRIIKSTSGYHVEHSFSSSRPSWFAVSSVRTTEAEARLAAEYHYAARYNAVLLQATVPLVNV